MRWIFIALVFLPNISLASAPSQDRDWNLAITAQGNLSSGEKFESIGVASFTGLDTLLSPRGGFDAAYRDFHSENNLTYGVWQEAEAFSNYLKNCNIDVPSEALAMRLGLNRLFSSSDDGEVNQVLTDLGSHLSFEKKIEFASRLGGMLLQGYDYDRAGGGPHAKGAVTLRQMIDARNAGGKAGVCRDMSQALAQSLKQMGVKEAYVIAYQTVGGGHATVLVQDPSNPAKTYNINYDYVTSTESGNSTSHLLNDSYIPNVGTDMRIYNADGKPLTTLPTNLGIALHEIMGGNASDFNPMLRSENQTVRVEYSRKGSFSVGAGASFTPDGDRVIGLASTYKDDSVHFPSTFSIALYNSERDTNMRGRLNTFGAYIEGEQRVVSDPITVSSSAGTARLNFEGKINFRSNYSLNELSEKPGRKYSAGSDMSATVGVKGNFQSTDGGTQVDTAVDVVGAIVKADVRDEGSTTFDLRTYNASASISQRLSSNLTGFAQGTVSANANGLGVTGREEVGLLKSNQNGSSSSVIIGHEGPIAGDPPVFVPGSLRTIYADVRHNDEMYGIGGGVFCRQLNDRKDCGMRSSATIKFGGPRRD